MQQIKLGQGGKSFLIQKGKILHDWQWFHGKKIEIDIIENQIFKTWMDGPWACFLNLITFRYIYKTKPNAHTHKSCSENKERNCKFLAKSWKLISHLEDNSKLQKHSNTLPKHPGVDYNQNQVSIPQELVEPNHTFHKFFHNRALLFIHYSWVLIIDSC